MPADLTVTLQLITWHTALFGVASSVAVVTRLRAGRPRIRGLIPGKGNIV